MNPHQQNKVDLSKLSADEQRLFRLYGKLPNKKDLLQNKLKERKYFDSGDYALSKAGKASDVGITSIGREHPAPEKIPHMNPANASSTHNGSISGSPGMQNGQDPLHSGSPIKEGTFLHRESSLQREASADDFEGEAGEKEKEQQTQQS